MTGPRRVKLTVSRADPWSVMKMSFLISVALGIAGVAMVAVLWLVLDGMGVFSDIERTVSSVLSSGATGGGSQFNLMDYIGFGRVVSLAIVIGVIDVILLTALVHARGVPLQRLLRPGRRPAADADRRLRSQPRTRRVRRAPPRPRGVPAVLVRRRCGEVTFRARRRPALPVRGARWRWRTGL